MTRPIVCGAVEGRNLLEMTMKSSEIDRLKSDFHRDGYVIVRDFISPEGLTELREHTHSVLQRLRSKDSKYNKHGLPQLHGNVAKGLERLDDYFKDFIIDGLHLALLTELSDETPTPATVGYFCKEEAEDEIHPHRDGDNGITIWFALDAASPDNGCVYFLPGSHLRVKHSGRLFRLGKSQDFSADPSAVAAILDPGDVSIHNSKTIHWSGKNKSGRPRRAINCFYQKKRVSTLQKPLLKRDFRG
jgi:phytanoyl-CoA hydroxylase